MGLQPAERLQPAVGQNSSLPWSTDLHAGVA